MKKNPILIHSLFRTGSTYIWNKFRQNNDYYCYYEPLHQSLANARLENLEFLLAKDFQSVNHPTLSKYYWYEYRQLLKEESPGLPYFKKSFGFDEFCHNEENPDLKKYIDHLISKAAGKVPVLQFNRTALRTRWFKTNYPGSLNIYVVRHPWDQWESYNSILKQTGGGIFYVMDILTASLNQKSTCFQNLAKRIPLAAYHHNEFSKEENFYQTLLECYSPKEKYFIFYYTWFQALVENVFNADYILNINLLSQNPDYRRHFLDFLGQQGIEGIAFEDAQIKAYTRYSLPSRARQEVENRVQKDILHGFNEKKLGVFFAKLPGEEQNFFRFHPEAFREKAGATIRFPDISQKRTDKFNKMMQRLEEKHHREKEEKETLINNKDKLIQESQANLGDLRERLAASEADRRARLEIIEKQQREFSQELTQLHAHREAKEKILQQQKKELSEATAHLERERNANAQIIAAQEKNFLEQAAKLEADTAGKLETIRKLQNQYKNTQKERQEDINKIKTLTRQLEQQTHQLARIQNTLSWKITKPLRWLASKPASKLGKK